LVWRGHDATSSTPLWPMAGDIEAPRVTRAAGERIIVFRQGGAIWMGAVQIDRDSVHAGGLARVSDPGPQVGAPSIDARGEAIVAAWAQRDVARGRWTVRWMRARHGARVGTVHTLAGTNDDAIAPSVAALDDGRFLLSWTEGGRAGHRVRAQLIGSDDRPSGAPLDLSAGGADAGQAQLAIGDDGHGTAGYLVAHARAF